MEKYIKLIRRLREDPEATIMDVSRKIKVPKSTVCSWLKRLKESNVVQNRLLVNFNELGYHEKVIATVKADAPKRDEIERYLLSHANMNTVCRLHGGCDILFEGIFRNQLDLKGFMEEFQLKFQLADISYYPVIDELKKEGFSRIE